MKKMICVILVCVTVTVFSGSAFAVSSMNETVNVNQRLAEIADKYEVGERLSDEDANFVKEYAFVANDSSAERGLISDETRSNFRIVHTDSVSGIRTIFSGYLIGKINSVVPTDNYYGIDDGMSGAYGTYQDNIISQEIVATCTCYGLAGDGGLIEAYSGQVTSGEQESKLVYMDKQEQITVLLATYMTVTVYVDIVATSKTGGGITSYRVYGENN